MQVLALTGVGEVTTGVDLGSLIMEACEADDVALLDGDIVCVAQKVVSKAEGAVEALPRDAVDVHTARQRVARRHAVRVIADTPDVLIVETAHGFVCANAGVDTSNVTDGYVTVLPEDPDVSARRLRRRLREATGADLGVIVTDTFGRPWRLGQTDVAIGVAGLEPLRDERGDLDRDGNVLEVTVAAVADELAGAADLVRRKASGAPFVIVRGAEVDLVEDASARQLLRPADQDLFRRARRDDTSVDG